MLQGVRSGHVHDLLRSLQCGVEAERAPFAPERSKRLVADRDPQGAHECLESLQTGAPDGHPHFVTKAGGRPQQAGRLVRSTLVRREPGRRFECARPIAERVADKSARNECPEFSLRVTVERDASPDGPRPDDARRAFGNLFKK